MEYRYLGKTGLKVSELCLGNLTFGWHTAEEDSYPILDRFAESGGNFIDTANMYGRGTSETIVGKWLKRQKRSDYVVATKARFPMGDSPNDGGLSRKHLLTAVEDSLRRLDTEYIDLYWAHVWDPGTPLEETLSTLHSLVQCGKVRYIGASNFTGWQLHKAINLSNQMGWEPFIALQPLYNLLDRVVEYELIPICQNEGVGIVPWSPLRGGWLSGKYRRGMSGPIAGTRVDIVTKSNGGESWNTYNNKRTWQIIDTLLKVAEAEGKTPAQVALNWIAHQPAVTAPIIGVRTLDHLEDNLGAVGWTISDEHLAQLEKVSALDRPYPYDRFGQGDRDR
jgi:aryl-alcohol dehydrogenase-like predicted oxidoreductase